MVKLFAEKAAYWMLVASVISLVMPTAINSLCLILFVVFWILSGNFSRKWARLRVNPAALSFLALFALYGLGMLYSTVPWQESLAFWVKYNKLLFIPIIVSLLDDTLWRRRAADAFLWGMLLVLAISYLKWMGWVPHADNGQGYILFKNRIAHNIFMAFTFYLLLVRAYCDVPRRWLWTGVALLAALNLLFLVNGRTGQLLLPVMLILFVVQHLDWRGGMKTLAGVAALSTALVFFIGTDHLQQMRMFKVQQEIELQSHDPSQETSSGLRFKFYKHTLAIAAERPWFGWGTGSFKTVYAEHEQRNAFASATSNPHNEYLLIVQQLGLFGLGVLMLTGWLTWRAANKLTAVEAGRLRALVLLIGIGALFNSLLLDSAEGKFYCLMVGIYLSGWAAPGEPREDAHAAN